MRWHVAQSATVPTSELARYAGDLRSITGGRGRFVVEHSHYDPVPSHLADKLAAAAPAPACAHVTVRGPSTPRA